MSRSGVGGLTRAVVVLLLGFALAGCHDDPAEQSTSTGRSATTLAGCALVTRQLLSSDLGLAIEGAGESSPSFFGARGVTDCAWFEAQTSISVHATDDAAADLPASSVQAYLDSGGQAVTGTDRGVAYATANSDGSNVALIAVRGSTGVEVAVATDTAISQAQADQLGVDVAKALG